MPSERRVSLAQLQAYLQQLKMERKIDEVIVHHTWSPASLDYVGIATVQAVRNYHMQVRGWSDNGYHVMIAPTGEIYLCRPMERAGAHTEGRNACSLGVSFIANFDRDDPQLYGGMEVGLQVVALLLRRFRLDERAIRFHREFAPKTCPGTRLSLSWVRQQMVGLLRAQTTTGPVRVVVLPDSQVIECDAAVQKGVTRVALRPLAEALGYRVHDHIGDQGKVYLERR